MGDNENTVVRVGIAYHSGRESTWQTGYRIGWWVNFHG